MSKSSENKTIDKQNSSVDKVMNQIWDLLKSMRFALILLLIITAGSIFNLFSGEFLIPVNTDGSNAAQLYTNAYGELQTNVLMFFQMYKPYSSWWFLLLLILMTFSLLVCVIERAPKVYRLVFAPRFISDSKRIRDMAIHCTIKGENAESVILSTLKKYRYKVWQKSEQNRILIDGEKLAWARSGAWLVHVGFILLFIGGAVILRATYETQAGGLPGDMLSESDQEWGFNVRVDDFIVEYFPLDVGQYVEGDGFSVGRIIDKNNDGTFDIEVFRPVALELKNISADAISNKVNFKTEGGRIDKASIADYIAILTVVEDGKDVFTQRVEVNRPLRYNGYRFYQSSFNDRVSDDQGRWMTILTVRKDNGAIFIWIGIIMVSIGLIMGMYFTPSRIQGLIEKTDGVDVVYLAGTTKHNQALFKRKFDVIGKRIRQDMSKLDQT